LGVKVGVERWTLNVDCERTTGDYNSDQLFKSNLTFCVQFEKSVFFNTSGSFTIDSSKPTSTPNLKKYSHVEIIETYFCKKKTFYLTYSRVKYNIFNYWIFLNNSRVKPLQAFQNPYFLLIIWIYQFAAVNCQIRKFKITKLKQQVMPTIDSTYFVENNYGPCHNIRIKFNHDSNYLGDEFISFWQVIIA
jgi:hypothetical protein